MSNFNQTQGSANSTKVTYAKLTSGVPFQCRVVGNVLRRYQYWIKNAAGKNMPFENLAFNRDTEKFDSGEGDPIREAGLTEISSYTKKVEPIKSKRAYAIMVLNRATNQYECLDLKKDIFDGMISYMQDSDISDVESVEWVIMKSGATWNDTKYVLDVLKTQKANKDQAAVAAQHEADKEILATAKPIEELFLREKYDAQKQRLAKHLAGTAEPSASDNSSEEDVNDLDD